jgi:flagellar biosynthesis protein FlhG
MVTMVPIASGKGGVGKTVIASNLGASLAAMGRTVVLVDLDLGGANLHTCLGVKNRTPGIGAVVWKQEKSLANLLVETQVERLWFIPGDNLLPGTANLEYFVKQRILRELAKLPADFVILDLGAGSSYNVVDFFLASSSGLLVIQPEPTSILNAYSFLKTSAFRMLYRSFPRGSEERRRISDFVSRRIEGTGSTLLGLAGELARDFPASAPPALEQLSRFYPRVVLNEGKGPKDASMGLRLRDIVTRNLGIHMEYIGFLLRDEGVPRSVVERNPICLSRPESVFARGISALAAKINAEPGGAPPRLFSDDEDLLGAVDEAFRESSVAESASTEIPDETELTIPTSPDVD